MDDLYFNNTRVLIVDDNKINLDVAKELVSSKYGISVDTALSGKEALAVFERKRFDLIFMDHMMPEMDGTHATMHIREKEAEYGYPPVPIVAITGEDPIDAEDLSARAGMNDFIVKPIKVEAMTEILSRWIPAEKRAVKKEEPPVLPAPAADVPKKADIIDEIAKATELDVQAGLSNVSGKKDVYERSLRLLCDKIPQVIRQTELALEQGNINDFTTYVHGMKSSLMTVGAASVMMIAANLEKAGKTNDIQFCTDVLPLFTENLRTLGEQLAPILNKPVPEIVTPKTPGTKGQFAEFVKELEAAADDYNYTLIAEVAEKMKIYDFGAEANTDIARIKGFLEMYDYDGFNLILNELKSNVT